MTGLLVSVRDAAEAELAVRGGADIIDVKEPARGSLGRPDPAEARAAIARARRCERPTSVALGELHQWREATVAAEAWQMLTASGPDFAKVGLADQASSDWRSLWSQHAKRMAELGVRPVAVAYADWTRARAPAIEEVVEAAIDSDVCDTLLIDTYIKGEDSLLDLLPPDRLGPAVARWRASGLRVALAGSVRLPQFSTLKQLGADIVAVRGAACVGERTSLICESQVSRCREALADAAVINFDD